MPPLDPEASPYIDLLFEAGPVQSGGMGASALSWGELESWLRLSRHRLSVWELRLIRRLSISFAAAQHEMRAEAARAPWPELDEAAKAEHAQQVDAALATVLSAMAARG